MKLIPSLLSLLYACSPGKPSLDGAEAIGPDPPHQFGLAEFSI